MVWKKQEELHSSARDNYKINREFHGMGFPKYIKVFSWHPLKKSSIFCGSIEF